MEKTYTCYTCLNFDELCSRLENGEQPPKICKKCAWHEQGDELPLKKRPNYISMNL